MNAEELSAQIRPLLEEIAREELPQVLREARAQAREQVRELLARALSDALLEQLAGMSGRGAEPRRAGEGDGAGASEGEDGLGVYVYGVVAAGEELPAAVQGIDPAHPPRLLAHGEVAAVVSEVPLAQFGEQQLRAHLQDLEWVERTARAHESLLEAVGERAALIPMRMCTIYRGEPGVREMLAREGEALREALRALAGKSEWGVKLFAGARSALPSGTGTPALETPRSGTDYLRQRQLERERHEREEQQLDQACAEMHLRLSAASCQSQVLAAPSSASTEAIVLNAVYLVDNARLEEFLREVEAVREEGARQGLELQRTGPWPAYNFVPGTIGATW